MMIWGLLLLCLLHNAAADSGGCVEFKQRCMKRAKCNAAQDTCVCPRRRTGDAEMDCYRKAGQRQCTVACDPGVTTWDGGEMVAINLPCWYRVTQLQYPLSPFRSKKFLDLNILACNVLTSDSRYYVGAVKIVVSITKSRGDHYRTLNRTSFSINSKQVQEAGGKNPWQYDETVQWQNLDFRFLWAKRDRFAIFKPPIKGATIKFRAFQPNQHPQVRKPGLSIVMPKKMVKVTGPEPWHGLCTEPGQGDLYLKGGMDSPSSAALYFSLLQRRVRRFDGQRCRQARKQVENCKCNKKLAIMTCGFLLSDRETVQCVQGAGQDPMELFVYCLRWTCQSRKGKCRRVHETIEGNGCPTSQLFTEIGCSQERLKIASDRFTEEEAPMPQ